MIKEHSLTNIKLCSTAALARQVSTLEPSGKWLSEEAMPFADIAGSSISRCLPSCQPVSGQANSN